VVTGNSGGEDANSDAWNRDKYFATGKKCCASSENIIDEQNVFSGERV
jgi:hypothetical protein